MLQVSHKVNTSLLAQCKGHGLGLAHGFNTALEDDRHVDVANKRGRGRAAKVECFSSDQVSVRPVLQVDVVHVGNLACEFVSPLVVEHMDATT